MTTVSGKQECHMQIHSIIIEHSYCQVDSVNCVCANHTRTRSSLRRKSILQTISINQNLISYQCAPNNTIHKNHPSSDMTCLYYMYLYEQTTKLSLFPPHVTSTQRDINFTLSTGRPLIISLWKVIQIYRKRKPESRKRLGGNGLTRMSFVTVQCIWTWV